MGWIATSLQRAASGSPVFIQKIINKLIQKGRFAASFFEKRGYEMDANGLVIG